MGHIANRIEALKARHRELDEAIAAAESRPYRDEIEITAMKKAKLDLRDEIAAIEEKETVAA